MFKQRVTALRTFLEMIEALMAWVRVTAVGIS
jgi:hypothetical protein